MNPRKVLLVDDDADVRLLVRVLLTAETIEVIEADSGAAALRVLESDAVDGMVLDWMMPEITGLDVLERMRSNPDLSDVPVLMLTAMTGDALTTAVDAGATRVMTKPFAIEELLQAVQSF